MKIALKNFQKKIPIPRAKILKTVNAAFRKQKTGTHCFFFNKKAMCPGFLSIVFVGARRMRAANKKYLKHDYVTDVLAFDLGEGCNEIIICPQVAHANAKAHQTSTEDEIILYVAHGILHLAGYDDHKPKDILQMRRMENKLLRAR